MHFSSALISAQNGAMELVVMELTMAIPADTYENTDQHTEPELVECQTSASKQLQCVHCGGTHRTHQA